jgi:hypothetical protein
MLNEVEKLIIKNGVICPQCNIKGLSNFGWTTTLAAGHLFEDEDHHLHDHDSNTISGNCTCLNDHQFVIRVFNSCWCGWSQGVDHWGQDMRARRERRSSHGVLGFHTSITEDENGKMMVNMRTYYKNEL